NIPYQVSPLSTSSIPLFTSPMRPSPPPLLLSDMTLNSPLSMSFTSPSRRSGFRHMVRYTLVALLMVASFLYLRTTSSTFTSVHQLVDVTPSHLPNIPPQQSSSTAPDLQHSPSSTKPAAEGVKTTILKGKPSAEDEKTTSKAEPAAKDDKTILKAPKHVHPIKTLIDAAGKTFDELLKKETHDLNSAAAAYRKRRGRHPPPGFDLWHKFAEENGALIVEDFFDQIYDDLGPFWGLPAATMRKEAWDFEMTINIRDHNASAVSEWFWTRIWTNLTQTIEHLLPDMDLPLNSMDEPRIVVPWEDIDKFMEIERTTRSMPPAREVITEFSKLPEKPDPDVVTRPKDWEETRPFWDIATRGCHPESLARTTDHQKEFANTPQVSLGHTVPHTYKGYVSNFTLSADFCHQPDLQGLHGMMISPLSVSSTKTLFPMFGGSKLVTNNEILLPAPMYWANEERFSGGDDHGIPWVEKQNKVIWRGVATGGKYNSSNWKGFQRHRFVAMTNSTQVSAAEKWTEHPKNWAMPPSTYNLAAQEEGRLGDWAAEWADTGFVELMCLEPDLNQTCTYIEPTFSVVPPETMSSQFTRKYVPDIDGNSFSGRYRGFLMSTSLPIKATIFREWHDSRLVPWQHFVPMDNRFLDFWGIMQYFLGYEGENVKIAGHDDEAQKIADAGQQWANKVLRSEDMQIYVLRLLLEYARISDDRRNMMGWVADII
ncbi:capsular associated protein, partial [Diplocarpon rosae]